MSNSRAEHNYNQRSREAVYSFFRKQLLGVDGEEKVAEREVEVEPLLDMLVWQGRSLPPNAVTQAQLFEQWKTEGKARVAAHSGSLVRRGWVLSPHTRTPSSAAVKLGWPENGRQVRFCSTPTKVFAWHARCPWSGRHCRICFRPY